MNRVAMAALAVSTIAFGGTAGAQSIDFSKVEIKTIDLGRNTYRLEGQGGNITVAVTRSKLPLRRFRPCRSSILSTLIFMAITPVATQAFKTRAPRSSRRTTSGSAWLRAL